MSETESSDLEHYPSYPDLLRYPDDLPFPRKMKYGPQTPKTTYLNADWPLPGSFPEPKITFGEAAWYDFLDKNIIYPGRKLSPQDAEVRQQLVLNYKNSNYRDEKAAEAIHGFDAETGFSPIFEFQYYVLNFDKFSNVLFFRLNGVNHTLHWDRGWRVDGDLITDYDPELDDPHYEDNDVSILGAAKDNFYLFMIVAECIINKDVEMCYYPVIDILKLHRGDPSKILPHAKKVFGYFPRRNPDPSEKLRLSEELRSLEQGFFEQPLFLRRSDLSRINELRKKLNLPLVDSSLSPVIVPPAPPQLTVRHTTVASPIADRHAEARAIYNNYLEKESWLDKHREYCNNIIKATQPKSGQTPIMPLATMGTGGGPLVCDVCDKQIPLEGGKYHGKLALDAWNLGARGYSFILGGVVFQIEENGTLRVYHGYPHTTNCYSRSTKNKKSRDPSRWDYSIHKKLDAFFKAERPDEDVNSLINEIRISLFEHDPGVGKNQP